MSDLNAIRTGQVNATGDARALFLKVFSGEVMTAFHQENKLMPLHMVKTITSGKSAQFPVFGTAAVRYHTPGTELTGQTIKQAERTINIDQLLVADAFIANIDEAMQHYDARSVYSMEIGKALAETTDQTLAKLLCLAARGTAAVSGGPDGAVINTITNVNSASELIDAIFAADVELSEKNVPKRDRYCLLRPAEFSLLVKDRTALNKDWSGAGSFAAGTLPQIKGITLIETNSLPHVNTVAVAGEENTYFGTFNKTQAVVFHRAAIGTVKLLDLSSEMEYSVRHQGTFMVSKYAMGHGILRPECAVEITED